MSALAASTCTADEYRHMARALQLARLGVYSVPPNPAVGCVIVSSDGRVAGEGHHPRAGEPHAEVLALRQAGSSARGATAYVTLEPCAHFGRTPPCADALVDARVARVVAALRDPNPSVAGNGLRKLAEAGIATAVGLLEAEARELNRGFISRMERGRPWVTIKLAASLDGRTGLANGASRWITGEAARADAQRLRARASAIVTGSGTVLKDDPSLTVRDPTLVMHGRRPGRVILDTSLRVPAGAKIFDSSAPTTVFTSIDAPSSRADALRSAGVEVQAVPRHASRLDLASVLDRLAGAECNEVLVEAGSTLAGGFVAAGLVDEIVCYLAPTALGDAAQPLLRLPLLERMDERREFRWMDVRMVGGDLRLTLRPK